MDDEQLVIKSNPFFSMLDENEFSKLLQHTTILNLQPKEILFHEGDFSDAFYIVKEGAIQITTVNSRGDTIFLARIGPGSFFGEQAFSSFPSPRRRANAIAQAETTLYKFPRDILIAQKPKDPKFQALLHEKGSLYIKEKLHMLVNSFQKTSYNLANLMQTDELYPTRSIVFYKNEIANRAYVLINGEIELRRYDDEKKIQQVVSIGPGQIFGIESLTIDKPYITTAVVKQDATVVVINSQLYHKMCEKYPLLKNLSEHFNSQLPFKTKGKMIQFHSEYLDLPATTSIISLNDGREIICQQVAGANIFLASITNTTITNEIKYARDENYNRTISLANDKIIGILDYGNWNDSSFLLELLIDGIKLNKDQLYEFTSTGHITASNLEKSDNDIICKCMRISQNEINNLITQGANFDEISKCTGAGTICGGCKPTILEMLGESVWSPCVISRVIDHNSDVKSFQLTPLHGKLIPFKPGQYLVVKAKIGDVWVQRNYTLTSSSQQPYYEITIKKEPKGLFSSWLFKNKDIKPVIYIAGPYGKFTLESSNEAPIICFMGGIGITPAIAYARCLSNNQQLKHIYIDYSAALAEQFILMDEFTDIEKNVSHFTFNHRITSINGTITEQEIKNIISSIEGCHVYVCGPKGLENLVTETFNQLKLSPERLHIEEFIHAGAPENISQTISL